MRPPQKRKGKETAIPEGFEKLSDPSDKRLQCKVCKIYNTRFSVVEKASANKHILSKHHLSSVENKDLRETRATRVQSHADAVSAQLSAPPPQQVKPHLLASLRAPLILHSEATGGSSGPSNVEQALWDQFNAGDIDFSVGIDSDSIAMSERARMEKEVGDLGAYDHEVDNDEFGFDNEDGNDLAQEDLEEDELASDLNRRLRFSPQDNEPELAEDYGDEKSSVYFPYPNKTLLALDMLDNMPRQRVSNTLMRYILWAAKHMDRRDVPSLDGLRKFQESLRPGNVEEIILDVSSKDQLMKALSPPKNGTSKIQSFKWRSSQGNIFYVNDIRQLIAKDYSNPFVRPYVHFYPEIPENNVVSEVWHGEKWRKLMDPDLLSPMFDDGFKHYYVNELTQKRDGSFVIPIRWVVYKGVVHADCYRVDFDSSMNGQVDCASEILVSTQDMTGNYFDVVAAFPSIEWKDDPETNDAVEKMPNPLRKVANGRPMYTSLVDLFCDDVSGNRSKSWNKHNNCYASHRNLPRRLLQQEFHCHFVTTSQNATTCEQAEAIHALLESTHDTPYETYDCNLKQDILLRLYPNTGPSDNPMGSEICSHIGKSGNYFCRKCMAGGTDAQKLSDEGFHSLFSSSSPRTASDTLLELEKQVKAAIDGVAARVTEMQASTGVKCKYTQPWIDYLIERSRELKKQGKSPDEVAKELTTWVLENKEKLYNPFLKMTGIDISNLKDTPVEILHTVLLGLVKYAWSDIKWTDSMKSTYVDRISAVSTSGLSIPPIRAQYIMQFSKSLIGRQLKQVIQTGIFCLYGIIPDSHFKIWKAVSALCPLLWYPEIDDMPTYLNDLRTAVANVLDTFSELDPTKIIQKHKYHILQHVMEDVVRHGPLVGSSTEIFECFNAVFRYCSIFSNHLAPSRDISTQLARQEELKHRLTGGWWKAPKGEWVQASPAVRDFLQSQPTLQSALGWTDPKALTPGQTKLAPLTQEAKGKRDEIRLRDTVARYASNASQYDQNMVWHRCSWAVSQSRDCCTEGSWIFAQSPIESSLMIGRVLDILTSRSNGSVIFFEKYELSSSKHEVFDMPKLYRRHDEQHVFILNAEDVQFDFNAQHDCHEAGCSTSGKRRKKQERTVTNQSETFIEHRVNEVPKFVINLSAFHNAHLVRRSLPRSLWEPVNYVEPEERLASHVAWIKPARDAATKKKQQQAEKRQAAKKKGQSGDKSQPPDQEPEDTETPDPKPRPKPKPRGRPSKKRRMEEEAWTAEGEDAMDIDYNELIDDI